MDPAFSIKKILIPINFTPESRRAFYAGFDLAAHYGAEIFVLHVSEPIRAYDFGNKRYVETKETIERVEEGVKARMDDLWEHGGVSAVDRRKVTIVVRGGKAHQEIVVSAAAKGADLIVMGDAGSGTAQRVTEHATCSSWW